MTGDWRSYADQYLGAMAGDVKTALNNINPNFDWSDAIKTSGTKYAALDGGLDPTRTPSTVLMQQAVLAARDANPQMDANYWNSIYNNLDPQRVSQAAEIQEWQSKQGDDDLGTLLSIAGLGLGVSGLFGFNPFSGLGELFGGAGAGAGGGLGVYGGTSGLAIDGALGQAIGPGLFGAEAITGGAGALGAAGGGFGSEFVGDLPIDPAIGGGLGNAPGIDMLRQMIDTAGGLSQSPQSIFNVQTGSFQPNALIEGINASGPMQGTINTLGPEMQGMFQGTGSPMVADAANWSVSNAFGSPHLAELAAGAGAAGVGAGGGPGLLEKLMNSYKQMKDPLSLLGAFRQWQSANDMQKMYKDQMGQFSQNGFPHNEFVQKARDFFDPAKRYQMLTSNPAYLEAARYAEQAQKRRNAGTGDLQSGYGDSLIADTLAKNAQNWDQQMFGNIKDASGMGFNSQNTQAQFAGQALPQINNLQNQADQGIFEALRKNQGMLPEIFKTVLG